MNPFCYCYSFFTCNGSSSDIWHCSVSITDIPKTCTVYILYAYIKYVFCVLEKKALPCFLFVCFCFVFFVLVTFLYIYYYYYYYK